MKFAFICTDDGNQDEVRARHLIEHLRYVESVLDKISCGHFGSRSLARAFDPPAL